MVKNHGFESASQYDIQKFKVSSHIVPKIDFYPQLACLSQNSDENQTGSAAWYKFETVLRL